MHRLPCLLALVSLPLLTPASAEPEVALRSYSQPGGQALRIQTTTTSHDGRIIIEGNGEKSEGSMRLHRSRTLQRHTSADGTSVQYTVVQDTSESSNELDAPTRPGSQTSALTGKTAAGFRDSTGHWHFYLAGKTPTSVEATELAELGSLENRRWFAGHPVKIGESWEIDPSFLRHLLLRDPGSASLEASVTLKEIKKVAGTDTAVLTLKIQSVAAQRDTPEAPTETATLNATGTLMVSLDTMLDHELIIEGSLLSTSRANGTLTTLILPFRSVTVRSLDR